MSSGGKRRWDQAPAPEDTAKAVVAKVQAQLAEKGLKFAMKDGPSKEIEINDSPMRFMLTKGALHEEVRRITGALVTTKGMYVANKATSKDRPLYLLVQASTTEQVDKAADWLQKVMSGQIIPESTQGGPISTQPPPPGSGPASSGPSSLGFDAKVFVGIEHSEAQPVGFSLIGKLFGQGGSFLKHISSSTGNTRVLLRGRYPLSSSPDGANKNYADEPLHLALSAPTQAQVDAAKGLAENLIEHVRKEWNEHRERKSRMHGPGTGYRGPGSMQQQTMAPVIDPHANPAVAAPPAMDPYYAQFYLQQLYSYDPAAYYAYMQQQQQQQQQQQYPQQAYAQQAYAQQHLTPAVPEPPAATLGPARPTATELAHSVTALPEAPPLPVSDDKKAIDTDGDAKVQGSSDEEAEIAAAQAAKRAALDSKTTASNNSSAAGAPSNSSATRPFWAPRNDSAPSPLLHPNSNTKS